MVTTICFLAGESAARSWRYVAPFLRPDETALFHELIGPAAEDPGYSWQSEIDAMALALRGRSPVHLAGFSAGGTLALAFIAAYPGDVASLTLVEPAWSYLPRTTLEAEYYRRLDQLTAGAAALQQDAFRRLIVGDDVELPPPRPDLVAAAVRREVSGNATALRVMTLAMQRHPVDPATFRRFRGRVFVAVGARSHPMWRDQAAAIGTAFESTRAEIFEERHHLDPPQRTETERLMAGLRWAQGID
jgi:pimeloyl-ACP methyl ester carboxylesterase